MINKFHRLALTSLVLLSSCADVVKKIDTLNASATQMNTTHSKLELVFSHNISGETHPCGCRHFPLGGMPQVNGLFHQLKKNNELLYVDTGDTFFPSSNIPKSMTESLSFAANNLATGLDMLGLSYMVPGDQDFAMGVEFLNKIVENHKFKFLISNLKDENSIKHEKYVIRKYGNATLFLVGLVNPEAINTKENDLFLNSEMALKNIVNELINKGYEPQNKMHRLIVLSHAGIEPDTKLAEKFPMISWIIGAHSQSFLRYSQDVGNVKIVQTLSKNHYVGDITIDLNSNQDADTYAIHEIRDELEKNVVPNPLRDFINAHKTKMNELQIKEQSLLTKSPDANNSNKKYSTALQCISCHKPQGEFWQSTPHSLAYATLMNVREQNNLTCVKCHSLGLNDQKGFNSAKTIVSFKDKPIIDYWNEAYAITSEVKSVRKLKPNEIKVLSRKWADLDKKDGIKHNFANVQCLNCHDKHDEHPFEIEPINKTKEEKMAGIKTKCLSCHTTDQSPEWYNKNQKGLPQNVNEKVLGSMIKKMSCPIITQ